MTDASLEPDRAGPGAAWPGSLMERVVRFFAADYRRLPGPVAIAVILAVAALLESGKNAGPLPSSLSLALSLLGTAPIAVIRRYPVAAITAVLAANAGFVLFGRLSWSVAGVAGWLIALAACPVVLPWRWAARAVALTEVAVLLGVAGLNHNATPWDATAAEALAVIAAWGAGEMVRARRQSAKTAEQLKALNERDVIARERASIARELHDVVAHHVSMIAVRAATAPYSVPDLPESGHAAFAEIADEARTALTELRVVLGVLRTPDGDAGADSAPQPRISDLECLIGRMTAAGMEVTLTVSGNRRPLPASVELCCYRIVQEALTNAGRHAPGSKVTVEVGIETASVTTRVANSAPMLPSVKVRAHGGYGLTGLRERVTMLRGEFSAGPDGLGGFVVRGVMPAAAGP
ncbi:MAG TPA: histidine kinase [Streptosporangiaceae bacterium]|nr:histidine kinase [Streptosporangiaceae bacterium]